MFDKDLLGRQHHSVCLELSRGKTYKLLALNELNNQSVWKDMSINPLKDKAQTDLFKDPVRTAL